MNGTRRDALGASDYSPAISFFEQSIEPFLFRLRQRRENALLVYDMAAEDPDGYIWEIMRVDAATLKQASETP